MAIKPGKKCDETEGEFVVVDIENDEHTGEVLAIGTSWREGAEIAHTVFHSWHEWISWVMIEAKDNKKFRTVYAHNGGGWDWISLAEYLMTQGKQNRQKIEIARAQSKMILMAVEVGHDFTMKFCDSLYLLRSKLEDLSKKLLGRGKAEASIEEVWKAWREDKPRFYRYLKTDCENLVLILEKALTLLHEHVAPIKKLGLTIGSTAMSIFRTGFLDREVETPTDPKVKEFLREGYKGGRVEVFKPGYFPNVNVYDLNSLYPTAMISCEVPVSARGDWTSIFRKALPGCYRIKFTQRRRDILPVLLVNGKGAYSGEGVYFSPEILLLMELDKRCEIQVLQGYVFLEADDKLFTSYVHTLYNLRLSDPGGPLDLLAKYLLNSLYGKFGQKAKREELVIFHTNDEMIKAMAEARERGEKVRELSPESNISTIERVKEIGFEHVGIAGMITATARVLLYRGILATGCDNVIYSDTDSVHTVGGMANHLVGTSLGQFKMEFSGEGVYCGKKLYALRNMALEEKKREKVRAKGVSVGGRNGCRLTFDDLLRVSQGAEIECRFSQPATVLQILTGSAKPCVIGNVDGSHNRKRKIRVTV